MKKISLMIIIGILIVGIVSAGVGLSISKSRDMDKIYRDELLTMTNAGEINPVVDIQCSDNYCLWSAEQQGIISSFSNRIDRFYCSNYNFTEGSCLGYTAFTDEEIQDIVADKVLSRLETFANASLSKEDYADWGSGNVGINEKK